MTISDVLAIFAVLVTVLAQLRQWYIDKRRADLDDEAQASTAELAEQEQRAEIARLVQKQSAEWIERQAAGMKDRDARIDALEKENQDLRRNNMRLDGAVIRLERVNADLRIEIAEIRNHETYRVKYIRYLLDGIRVLFQQICALNITPQWDVDSYDDFVLGLTEGNGKN